MLHRYCDRYRSQSRHEWNDSSVICINNLAGIANPPGADMKNIQICLAGMRGYDGLVYTFTNPYEKMTRDQADVHCKRMHSEICKVNDEATQKILSESSETLQTSSSGNVWELARLMYILEQ